MSNSVCHTSIDVLMPLFQEQLAAGHSICFSPKGVSMLPMLREGIDSVVLSPVNGKLKKYDLPLYRRDNGKYVLHRIVHVGEAYTCMGDNQYVPEPGLRQDQMIGVVTAFYRGNRKYAVEHLGYRLYCRIWYASRSVRHLWKRGVRWLQRHLN